MNRRAIVTHLRVKARYQALMIVWMKIMSDRSGPPDAFLNRGAKINKKGTNLFSATLIIDPNDKIFMVI